MKKGKSQTRADRIMQEALEAVEKRQSHDTSGANSSSDDDQSNGDRSMDGSDDVEVMDGEDNAEDLSPSHGSSSHMIQRETYLRLFADFENYRKRAQKDREAAELSGKEKILRGFLEILDSFDRGFSNLDEKGGVLEQGVRMILSQADHWLKTEGLERIQTTGAIFDPTVHEAVSTISHDTIEAGRVVSEVRRGYRWHRRLLRAASVVVSKGPQEGSFPATNSTIIESSSTESPSRDSSKNNEQE